MNSFLPQVVIGMDVAASEFFVEKEKKYDLNFKEEVVIKSIHAFVTILTCALYYEVVSTHLHRVKEETFIIVATY